MSRSLVKKELILPSWLHWQESKQRQEHIVASVGFAVTTCWMASSGEGKGRAPGENIAVEPGEGGGFFFRSGVRAGVRSVRFGVAENPDGDAVPLLPDACVMARGRGKKSRP